MLLYLSVHAYAMQSEFINFPFPYTPPPPPFNGGNIRQRQQHQPHKQHWSCYKYLVKFRFFLKFCRIKCATQTQPHLLPLCQWLKYRQTHAKHIRMDRTHINNKNADRLFLCVSITFMRAHEFGYLTMMRLNQKKMCSAGHLCSFTIAYMDGKDDLCDRNCLAFLCYWLLMDIAIPIDLIDIIYLPMALKLSDSND